jgi:hypothetical protein
LILLLAGCGQSGLKPRGQLLNDGLPFVPGQGQFVQVSFVSVSDEGKETGTYLAGFDPGISRFVVNNTRPMPPGKYRISVQVMKQRKDLLNGRVGPLTSPFVFDIQTGDEEIKVDLATVPEPARKRQSRSRPG